MNAPEWPDKTINSLLEEQPQGFHFHPNHLQQRRNRKSEQ